MKPEITLKDAVRIHKREVESYEEFVEMKTKKHNQDIASALCSKLEQDIIEGNISFDKKTSYGSAFVIMSIVKGGGLTRDNEESLEIRPKQIEDELKRRYEPKGWTDVSVNRSFDNYVDMKHRKYRLKITASIGGKLK